jgi:probable F420-dependent oxidoreductase
MSSPHARFTGGLYPLAMKLGVKLPHTGTAAPASTVPVAARELEQSGFDSLWVSDHVVMPQVIESPYPFSADGRATWSTDVPYVEALICLAAAAASTERVRLGTAALVLPQRNPVLLAKQAASIDAMSGGRLVLGVGAGWLREEFVALQAPFEARGARTQDWITLLRECWTGRPPAHVSEHYRLAADTIMLPTPMRSVPLLVAGHSRAALRRAGRLGDGWLAQQAVPELDLDVLAAEIGQVRLSATETGRNAEGLEFVLRLVESASRTTDVAIRMSDLIRVGVTEIIVDVPIEQAGPAHELLRDAAAR